MNTIVSFLFLTSGVMGLSRNSSYYDEFSAFITKHNKNYINENDTNYRYKIFADNMDIINKHNNEIKEKGHTFEMGMTQFTDLTNDEFKSGRSGCLKKPIIKNNKLYCSVTSSQPPSNFSWVRHSPKVVTPVKNQQQCGSCWAFSTTGSVESANAIKTKKLVSLSEQELVDCSGPEGNMGCGGGFMTQAFQYIMDNKGLCSEKAYPYTASDGQCQSGNCTNVVSITGYGNITAGDEDEMKIRLLKQPISIAMQADLPSFQNYKKGIYHDIQCNGEIDHGVLLVGYGHNQQFNKDYWIVKNSWGNTWGNKGYFAISRNVKKIGNTTFPNGMCSVASNPSYPIV